ncbi:MAG: hypothetical protein DI628_00030 [Blastochloris viridis]|uniref:Uncharacterized protein n=1 Tax=Blastochloris viridis TaxID=1079 RepID=A0A6N4RCM4_BLAVI|nr:MAG: hypothetical protein DI628_00030 [Blastochloris viridis]
MSLLIEIYHHHRLPAGEPELAKRRDRINQQAEEMLEQLRDKIPTHKPATPLEGIHHIVRFRGKILWSSCYDFLYERYKGNYLKDWPCEVLMLLAELFPADGHKQKLDGKQCYRLFKSLTAMLLHLEEERQLATA